MVGCVGNISRVWEEIKRISLLLLWVLEERLSVFFSQIPNQSLMASSRWLIKVCKRRLERINSQRGKKFQSLA